MAIVTTYYESLSTALDAVERHQGILFRETCRGHDQSIVGIGEERGESLDTYVNYCRTFKAPYLAERTQSIAELSSALQATGMTAASMKRRQVWARQGSKINPHRVLRGQLSTAWRKTVREQRSSTMGRIAIVLNLAFSANILGPQILWSTAATLALAEIARKAGRAVDLYGVAYVTKIFETCSAHALCIPLLKSSEVWSIHNTALSTSPAMLRRLCFRLWEIEQPRRGPVNSWYGSTGKSADIRAWVTADLAPKIGLPASAIYLGCTQADKITDMHNARFWLQGVIENMDAA